MGYYITMEDAQFRIPAEHLQGAWDALVDLNTNPDHAHLKNSGSRQEPSFAWAYPNYHEAFTTVAEVFQMIGFETCTTPDEDFEIVGYDGKAGDEFLFLRAVAPYVTPGSFLHFRGEEGEHFRYLFNEDNLIEEDGFVTFR